MQIVSLFDYTGEALKPWAEAGYECFAYDIQHTGTHRDGISFLHADLHDSATVRIIVERHAGEVVDHHLRLERERGGEARRRAHRERLVSHRRSVDITLLRARRGREVREHGGERLSGVRV